MTGTTNGQPGAAIARRPTAATVAVGARINNLEQAVELSKTLAHSSLIPDGLRGQAPNILVMIMYAQDLGLSPMQAIQGAVYVVKGKPLLAAQTWIALARRAGHNPYVNCKHCTMAPEQHAYTGAERGAHDYEADHDQTRCKVTVVRGDTRARHTETFTMEDAATAKLDSNDNYRKHPKRMLLARAISNCCRFICPEIALGFYAEGEEFTDDFQAAVDVALPVEAEDVTDAEVVAPEQVAAEIAGLAAEHDFTPRRQAAPEATELDSPLTYSDDEIAEGS